jgi:hypothetical protein
MIRPFLFGDRVKQGVLVNSEKAPSR